MYDMAKNNAKKNHYVGKFNNIKRVQNALRGNDEELKLEVKKTSNMPHTLQRTMG